MGLNPARKLVFAIFLRRANTISKIELTDKNDLPWLNVNLENVNAPFQWMRLNGRKSSIPVHWEYVFSFRERG